MGIEQLYNASVEDEANFRRRKPYGEEKVSVVFMAKTTLNRNPRPNKTIGKTKAPGKVKIKVLVKTTVKIRAMVMEKAKE